MRRYSRTMWETDFRCMAFYPHLFSTEPRITIAGIAYLIPRALNTISLASIIILKILSAAALSDSV